VKANVGTIEEEGLTARLRKNEESLKMKKEALPPKKKESRDQGHQGQLKQLGTRSKREGSREDKLTLIIKRPR